MKQLGRGSLLSSTLAGLVFATVFAAAPSANATTCIGNCGAIAGTDGVVTAPPNGDTSYQYVSTYHGVAGGGQIAGVGGANGSQLTTDTFHATAGQQLSFYFNYVTSDGSGYADYSWASLRDVGSGNSAYLFTARTEPTGNTSPGIGLPSNSSVLNPVTSAIHPGGPAWSALGGSSGNCWAAGCGYTGWIQATYTVGATGDYQLNFGVSNYGDSFYDSGLAFDGATIGATVIHTALSAPAPTPASGGALGLAALVAALALGRARAA
jgi:hypothetical protein